MSATNPQPEIYSQNLQKLRKKIYFAKKEFLLTSKFHTFRLYLFMLIYKFIKQDLEVNVDFNPNSHDFLVEDLQRDKELVLEYIDSIINSLKMVIDFEDLLSDKINSAESRLNSLSTTQSRSQTHDIFILNPTEFNKENNYQQDQTNLAASNDNRIYHLNLAELLQTFIEEQEKLYTNFKKSCQILCDHKLFEQVHFLLKIIYDNSLGLSTGHGLLISNSHHQHQHHNYSNLNFPINSKECYLDQLIRDYLNKNRINLQPKHQLLYNFREFANCMTQRIAQLPTMFEGLAKLYLQFKNKAKLSNKSAELNYKNYTNVNAVLKETGMEINANVAKNSGKMAWKIITSRVDDPDNYLKSLNQMTVNCNSLVRTRSFSSLSSAVKRSSNFMDGKSYK